MTAITDIQKPGPIDTLLAITQRLVDVITAENEHLKSSKRPAEARPLIEEKGRLSAAFTRELEFMKKNGGVKAFGSEEKIALLTEQTSLFQKLLDEHRKILERTRAITEGILKAVGDEVTRQNNAALGYGKNAAPPVPRALQPTSLSLNEVI